jgi:general secretion pathway protein D
VVRDARETSNLALDRYELMRAVQKDAQPLPSSVLQIHDAPVMPPLRAPEPVVPPLTAPAVSSPVVPLPPQ